MPRIMRGSADATQLGALRDADALARLVDWAGLSVVDVGCGEGRLARGLAAQGATVMGLEPSPVQAARNAAAEPTEGVTLAEGAADHIPRADASVDVVIFSRSLHHIPADHMDAALREAARVLKPSGQMMVIEPDIDGVFSQLVLPFHDETVVRTLALDALERTADALFTDVREAWFTFTMVYDAFDGLVARMAGSTFNDIQASDIDTPEVRANFELGKTADGYVFENPNRVRIYSGRR